MFYEALYRRWRPKVFEDIIGQEETITILKNQIKYSNIAHAYLFTGMRGTGKTSTARIFARAVNCTNPQDANPCNNCDICRSILAENSMDIIEIDAASNRGIDNIRELREHTKYNPSEGKYKIYIIDEVHMLTKEASNALLKTLEEPPAHVIFILATTEPHGVAPTILSRCQRFDFKPVKTKDIINQLSLICEDIPIDYEEEALRVIALNSGGALRDALSILDRCVSFNNEVLKYDHVINILGAVNYEFIFDLAENIGKQDISGVLKLINEIFAEGRDAGQLMKDLISHFRSLLFVKMDVETDEILALPEERLERFKKQGKLFSINQISYFIYTLSDIESKLKHSSQPKILMEIAAASLCNRELNDSLEGIIERVKHLEKTMACGDLNTNKNNGRILDYGADEVKGMELSYSGGQKQDDAKKPEDKKAIDIRGNVEQEEKPQNDKVPGDDKKSRADKKPGSDERPKGDRKPEKDEKPKSGERVENNDRALNTIKNIWEQVLDEIRRDKKPSIGALLKEGTLERLSNDVLTISLRKGFEIHCNRLNKEKTKEYISNIIAKFTGRNIGLSFVIEDRIITQDSTKEQKDPVQKLKEMLPGEIFDIVEIIDG